MYTSESYTCTLPTGAAWDRTIDWIIETEDKDLSKATYNSSDWGNYSNIGFEVTSANAQGATDGKSYSSVSEKPESKMLLTTGAAPNRNVSNNIFDLAGKIGRAHV